MTEEDWMTCAEPTRMLEFLRGRACERKLRLFACACCRDIWQFITDPGSRTIVELTEQSADCPVDIRRILELDYDRLTDNCGGPDEAHAMAFMVAGHVGHDLIAPIHGYPFGSDEFKGALETARGAVQTMAAVSQMSSEDKMARYYSSEQLLAVGRRQKAMAVAESQKRRSAEEKRQSSHLRCIIGNPWRQTSWNASWITPAVSHLASSVYETRELPSGELDPGRLRELADILEEANCAEADILNHLRGPGPHVRGCWVIDLILDRQ